MKWLVKKVKKWLKSAKKFFSGKKDKKGSKKVAETSGEDKARIDGEGMEDENFEYTTDVSKVKGWWKEDEEFKFENGEKHELYFEIKDGKIIKHTDDFDFYKWAKQAFGITGVLVGWTVFFKNKVRVKALEGLKKYIQKNPD